MGLLSPPKMLFVWMPLVSSPASVSTVLQKNVLASTFGSEVSVLVTSLIDNIIGFPDWLAGRLLNQKHILINSKTTAVSAPAVFRLKLRNNNRNTKKSHRTERERNVKKKKISTCL